MTISARLPADHRHFRRILTPEGVELVVELGERGARAAAFLIDLLFVGLAIVAIVIGAIGLAYVWHGWGLSLALLAFFLVRCFYFSYFELRWRGTTPGKRLIGLRVIDRAGGPLRPEAVVARNLMREIEVFLPLSLLFLRKVTDASATIQILLLIWAGIFLFMPLFNRDRLRLGDLVGGTMVIAMPKAALLPDLIGAGVQGQTAAVPASTISPYRFSDAQLDFYGIYELQTLEKVLRQDKDNDGIKAQIAERIRHKIGWMPDGTPFDADEFLTAFYAAQRARLERKMLFGVRRRDKNDRR
jgi:uncharacterized RDD family membrane protein YckC